MQRGLVAHRNAKSAQDGPDGYIRSVELTREVRPEADAHVVFPALGDERVAIKPDPVGNARQQRFGGRKDASARQVRSYVGGDGASVDRHGDRSCRWE